MRSGRLFHALTVGLLVAILMTGALPVGADHAATARVCPQSDATLAQQNSARYYDFNLVEADVVLDTGSGTSEGEPFGAFRVFKDSGTFKINVTVANNGTQDPDPTFGNPPLLVRATLTKPDGSDQAHDIWLDRAPKPGATRSGSLEVPVTVEGTQSLLIEANPVNGTASTDSGRDYDEVCHDTQGVYPLYDNNDDGFAAMVGAFPDLQVSSVSVDDPEAASRTANAGTKATVTATVKNAGTATAFAHTAETPGEDTFAVGFAIEGATCEGGPTGLVPIETIPAGGQTTVTATCELKGLAGDTVVTVSADHDDVVYETLEGNNKKTAVVHIPAADIRVEVDTGLSATPDGVFLLPAGQGLGLNYTIENAGDAPAAAADGSGFTTKVLFDTETDPVKETTVRLESFEAITETAYIHPSELTARQQPYDVHILPDMEDKDDEDGEVLETDEDNLVSFQVLVASFEVALSADDNETTVPPGVAGKIGLTVENAGTVAETIALETPAGADGRARYTDAGGATISSVRLDAGASLEIFLEHTIPGGAAKDERFTLEAVATSTTAGANATDRIALTFITGEDDVPPTVSLHDPRSGFLSGDKVTVRVTDNVEVEKVESDLGGSFETLVPSEADPSLYTLDVTGNPGRFSFSIRAADVNGNQVTETLEVVRDETPPRIVSHSFDPPKGAVPGQKVRVFVDARDDNMKGVTMIVRQKDDYRAELQAVRGGGGWVATWTVPTKPGAFVFEMVAEDQAGNRATVKDESFQRYNGLIPYFAAGYDIEVLNPTRPTVFPRDPEAGQQVRFTYQLRNTNEQFGMERFEVRFAVDRATFVDRKFIELGPGETRAVTMVWTAEPGPHTFNLIVDRNDDIPESDEENNAPTTNTQTVFRTASLFEAPDVRPPGFLTFTERLEKYWFLPVLLAANVVLFIIAAVLGRRPTA